MSTVVSFIFGEIQNSQFCNNKINSMKQHYCYVFIYMPVIWYNKNIEIKIANKNVNVIF